MKIELLILLLTVGLGFIQLLIASAAATKVRGKNYNFSSRDEQQPSLKGKPARLDRAFKNFQETFPFFLAGVFIVMANDKAGMISAISAIVYLLARMIYVFLYVYDVIYVRTAVWMISVLGILGLYAQNFL
ncbi:MAG: MAPEG family protein [Bdellovibrio sp.]|nr:MAPEG family protein [Bdellovibrio sp.]